MDDPTPTDKFLMQKYPHLKKAKSWLKRLNDKLGLLGGSVEQCTRWKDGHPDWTDWKIRELSPRKPE